MKLLIPTIISFSIFLFGCGGPSEALPGSILENVSVEEFETHLQQDVQVLDVRTAGEFAGDHLENAINIDYYSDNFEEQLSVLDKNKPVLVYCLSGSRSESAAEKLNQLGFKSVYNLKGGIRKWKGSEKPVVSGTAPTPTKEMSAEKFVAEINSMPLVIVDYYAPWCEPCRKMAPMLEKLAKENQDRLKLLKINVEEHPTLSKENGIESIPVLEIYHKGDLVWKQEGRTEEADLVKEINKYK